MFTKKNRVFVVSAKSKTDNDTFSARVCISSNHLNISAPDFKVESCNELDNIVC